MKAKIFQIGFVLMVYLLSALFGIETGKGLGEDTPLPVGGFVLQGTQIRDMPEAGEVELPGNQTQRANRGAIIPSIHPDGEIRFVLDSPVNQVRTMAAVISRSLKMDFSPALKGNFSWKSPTELVFSPNKGQLNSGDWVTVRVTGKIPLLAGGEADLSLYRSWYVSAFQMGTKSSGYEIKPGKPRFVASLDSGSDSIGLGMLNLLYDQPVNPKTLASQLGSGITATLEGSPLKIEVQNPSSLSFDPEREYALDHVLRVIFLPLPPQGSVVEITLPTLDEYQEKSTITLTKTIQREFLVESSFLDSLSSGESIPLTGQITLSFSNRYDYNLLMRELILEPKPLALSLYRNDYNNELVMNYRFTPGTDYKLAIGQSFTDLLGNPLSPPVSATFRSPDLPSILNSPAQPLVLETKRNRLPLEVRNLDVLKVRSWVVDDPLIFSQLLASYPLSSLPDLKGMKALRDVSLNLRDLEMNQVHSIEVGLGAEPGLKVLEISAGGRGSEKGTSSTSYALIQTTDLGVSSKISEKQAFLWVTALSIAKPVMGAKIQIYDLYHNPLGSGTTVGNGTLVLEDFRLPQEEEGKPSDLVLVTQAGSDRSVSLLKDTHLSQSWQFNLPGLVAGARILPAALFTDRGVYRPGEEVHLKAFLRPDKQFDGGVFSLRVIDPQGQMVLDETLKTDNYRGLNKDITIDTGAPVGEYQVTLSSGESTHYQARTSFRVEEYRVPTFQVFVKSREVEWISGSPVTLEAKSEYLQGALMGGSNLSWRVYRQPEIFSVSSLPGYIFGGPRDPSLTGTFSSQDTTLNADSTSLFTFTPESFDPAGPLKYIAQAAVTDVEQQTYAGRISRLVHPADYYVGLIPPPRTVFRTGDLIPVSVVVVDILGKINPGKTVEVWLDQINYHTTTMMDESGTTETYNREVIRSQKQADLVSTASPVGLNVKVDSPGAWELRLVVKDLKGRSAAAIWPLTISGDKSASWPRFDLERMEITLDKNLYKAGETAQVVSQSPFTEAEGLLTIEGDGVMDLQRFSVSKNTPSIKFVVKPEYTPNCFVSVILIRGRTHDLKDASGFETGAPAYRIGYTRLNVDPQERRLSVTVKPQAAQVRPGSPVTVQVSVADWKGLATGGSAAVAVVDEAVLGLTGFKTPDPVALAYALRQLGVRNASSLLDLPHSRRNRLEALFPGGDSDESEPLGAEDPGRRLFKSTAYWNPSLTIDAQGQGSFTFTMPDNLSTYRVMVVTSEHQGRMGSGFSQVRSNLPLMVQAVIPRFAYQGDKMTLQARVFNTTEKSGSAEVTGQFTGFTVEQKPAPQVTVPSKKDVLVPWTGTVSASAGELFRVSLAGKLGTDKDGVQMDIPIRSPGNRTTVVSSQLTIGTKELTLDLPPQRLPGTGKYEVVLSESPLSELKDAVTYLMAYPNGCIEQTTSTAYPLIVLKDLLPAIGVEVNMADLKAFSEAGVKRILSFKTTSGGLAYWPGSNEPHAFATSFGLTCLLEAKKRGYDVPDADLRGMADYLEATLKKGVITEDIPHGSIADGDTRALFLMTLGRLGRPQSAGIAELWRQKDKLTPFGLSFLAVAIRETKADQSLLEPVLEEIRKATQQSSEEAWYESERKGGYSMDSPLRTHASALLAYSLASGKPEMNQRLLKGFLSRRQGGLWGNTQENVFGIMAIYQLVGGSAAVTPGAKPPADQLPVITLGGKVWPAASLENPSPGMYRLKFTDATAGSASLLKVLVDTRGRTMYTTLRATVDIPLTPEFRSAQNHGFGYTRTYETLEGRILDPAGIPLGTVVKVRLQLQTAAQKNYVAVDDKLPAGFEAMNMNLETTDKSAMGQISQRALLTLPTINYQEIRDHRVVFYVDNMTPGSWEFVYLAKASTPGTFLAPAGLAEAMYETEYNGTTKVDTVTIR